VSYAIDVNVLLYASDSDSRLCEPAKRFLARCAATHEAFCIAWITIMSYLRIATHPSIFAAPLTPRQATDNVEALLALPHVHLLVEDESFWEVYCRITGDLSVRGNLVPDAHLAALLVEHGVSTLYTHDADFRRFADLDVRNPFE
jgi:toxin-antitoxin system PIN domain toxin